MLSRARHRSSMARAQPVRLAEVACVGRSSAVAAGTALAVRLGASISSTQAQGENNTSCGSSSLEGVQPYPIRLVNCFMSK
jgi:hypothetical protein